jgi:uncharacterized protein (TIGR03437 family)
MNHKLSYLRIALAILAATLFAAAQVPVINPNGVVEGASFTNHIVAGGFASIFGANLAPSGFVANTIPLPTILNTVQVTLDGDPCPLLYVSPNQINFQVRWEKLSLNSTNLIVKTANGQSNTYPVALSAVAPGLFALGTPAGQGAVLISGTGTFAAAVGSIPGATSRPAAVGEFVSIYCSGLGDVSKEPADGTASPAAPNLATVKALVQATIGGNNATVSFAGLAPGFVGLYQVDAQVPSGVTGPVNVQLSINGVLTTFVKMTVQ